MTTICERLISGTDWPKEGKVAVYCKQPATQQVDGLRLCESCAKEYRNALAKLNKLPRQWHKGRRGE